MTEKYFASPVFTGCFFHPFVNSFVQLRRTTMKHSTSSPPTTLSSTRMRISLWSFGSRTTTFLSTSPRPVLLPGLWELKVYVQQIDNNSIQIVYNPQALNIIPELYVLKTLNILDLDYDLGAKIYSLDLQLTDAADRFGNTRSTIETLLVNVTDQPDQPPLWVRPCGYKAMDEGMEGRYYQIFV